jgi:hypothetical protein
LTEDRVLVLGGADGPELDLVEGEGIARAVLWPGVGARLRAMHHIVLDAGAATLVQRHPGEAVYAILDGDGVVRDGDGIEQPLTCGSMFHVEPGTAYAMVAGPEGMEAVGGPAPVDEALYERVAG